MWLNNSLMDFSFQYVVVSVKAQLDERTLRVKQGIRSFEIPLQSLRMLYFGPMPPGDFDELILVSENERGKRKKFRFYANDGEEGMSALVAELVRRHPSIDLRSLDRKAALAKMGAADTARLALVAVPLLVLAVMGAFVFPFLAHGLDDGRQSVTIEELNAGRELTSRNLVVRGVALAQGLEEKTTRKGTTTTRLFFPLVSQAWTKADPIHVLVETDDLSDAELDAVLARNEFAGVLRNVWWEGPSESQIDFFTESYGFKVSPDVVLIELGADRETDLAIFGAIMGITGIIMIVVCVFMWKKMG